jgi:hypothetical protein
MTMYGVVLVLALLVMAGTVWACGVRSPGYWKNHPEAWPVSSLSIGADTYTKEQAIIIMQTPGKGDKSYTLFNAVVAALLNEYSGAPVTCIATTLAQAIVWVDTYPPGSGVEGSSEAWKCGEPLYCKLDAYNNGQLCVPSED